VGAVIDEVMGAAAGRRTERSTGIVVITNHDVASRT